MLRTLAHLCLCTLLALAPQAQAQSPFSTALSVNNKKITYFELEQRAALLSFLGVPGDTTQRAREELIDERIRQQLIEDVGLALLPEQETLVFEQFAARGNLSPEDLLLAIELAGISEETVREFTGTQALWNEYVRQRFGAQARPSEAEIDRAVAIASARSGTRIRLAEIALPIRDGDISAAIALANEIRNEITSVATFGDAARRYSVSPTRIDGGLRDWIDLNTLPPGLASVFLTLAPGEVTEPIQLGEAVTLFQLRSLQETAPRTPRTEAVDYLTVALQGPAEITRGAIADLRASIDVCNDLYPFARDLPAGAFQRRVVPIGEVPRGIAVELATLDENEFRVLQQSPTSVLFVMLCSRTTAVQEGEVETVTQQLVEDRLLSYADSLIDSLRADAIIRTP